MGQQNKITSKIPKHGPSRAAVFIDTSSSIKTYKESGNKATVLISLRYTQYEFECFSEWNKIDMKTFWEFNRAIHKYQWQDVIEQGSKGKNKVGFAYTQIQKSLYPNKDFVSNLSPEMNIFELRLSGKIRVHGFRSDSEFYICWLDRNHRICN